MTPDNEGLGLEISDVSEVIRFLELTAGAGRNRPKGRGLVLWSSRAAVQLAEHFEDDWSRVHEAWISLSAFRGDYRSRPNWLGAAGIGIDVDYYDLGRRHARVPAEKVAAAMSRVDVANLVHPTPRGFRAFLLFDDVMLDPVRWDWLAERVGSRLEDRLHAAGLLAPLSTRRKPLSEGFVVDWGATRDLTRIFFTPRAEVDGERRSGETRILREAPFHV